MRRRTVLRAAVLLAMLAAGSVLAAGATGADGGNTMNVHASLSTEAAHEKVLVTFRIENRGERRVWLPRAIASNEGLTGRLFELHALPGGEEVPYIGPWIKRGPMMAPDFFELAPHSAHTHTIDITPFYDFKPGQHSYEIRYVGEALGDVKQLEATSGLQTDAVRFTHTAPPAAE
jgi:hypothetical protein